VHEGPHSFSSNIPLVPGHVITNEPGFCKFSFCFYILKKIYIDSFSIIKDLDGKWGVRIESALSVRRVKVSYFLPLISMWLLNPFPLPLRHAESLMELPG
jgi:Xaa-Pro aminopeptidase